MNPFATTAATARGCSINYEPRAFTRLHLPILQSYNVNSITFLSFVAKDGVHKFNKHLSFHRGSDAGRLLPGRTSILIAGGTLVVIVKTTHHKIG